MRCLRFAAVYAAAICLSAVAQGGTLLTQDFLVRGGGETFDSISISIDSPSTVTGTLSNLSDGWDISGPSTGQVLSATGPATTENLNFDVTFSDQTVPFTFVFEAFKQGTQSTQSTLIEQTNVTWNGASQGTWSFAYMPEAPAGRDVIAVPTPAAASVGLPLLGLMGGLSYLRKRRIA